MINSVRDPVGLCPFAGPKFQPACQTCQSQPGSQGGPCVTLNSCDRKKRKEVSYRSSNRKCKKRDYSYNLFEKLELMKN